MKILAYMTGNNSGKKICITHTDLGGTEAEGYRSRFEWSGRTEEVLVKWLPEAGNFPKHRLVEEMAFLDKLGFSVYEMEFIE